jgi:hypothetical protein
LGDSDSFFANEMESDEEQSESVATMPNRPVRWMPALLRGGKPSGDEGLGHLKFASSLESGI